MKKTLIALSITVAVVLAGFAACAVAIDGALSTVDTTLSEPLDPAAGPDATGDAAGPSTCAAAREALLTGTEKDVRAAMTALQADKSAPAGAREAARDWLNRTDPDLRESAAGLVQMGCSW